MSCSKTSDCGRGCRGEVSDLPDSPDCAVNYHFGMMLGAAELRAEQGFHVGRARRHQRVLHGSGVLCGLDVRLVGDRLEVFPGMAVDPWGREISVLVRQCVSVAAWWEKHRSDADLSKLQVGPASFDVCLRAGVCLDKPVPAISPGCDPDLSQGTTVEHARICERFVLGLELTPTAPEAEGTPEPTLAARLLGALDDMPSDAATTDGGFLSQPRAGAVALEVALDAALRGQACPSHDAGACVVLGRLTARVSSEGASKPLILTGLALQPIVRPSLLATQALQRVVESLLSPPPLITRVEHEALTMRLDLATAIAPGTATDAAFRVSNFTGGAWSLTGTTVAAVEDAGRRVHLTLAQPLQAGPVRIVLDTGGPTPLLGADLRLLGRFANTHTFTHAT